MRAKAPKDRRLRIPSNSIYDVKEQQRKPTTGTKRRQRPSASEFLRVSRKLVKPLLAENHIIIRPAPKNNKTIVSGAKIRHRKAGAFWGADQAFNVGLLPESGHCLAPEPTAAHRHKQTLERMGVICDIRNFIVRIPVLAGLGQGFTEPFAMSSPPVQFSYPILFSLKIRPLESPVLCL